MDMGFSCRKNAFFQASIKLAQPFPAPELRTRILGGRFGYFLFFFGWGQGKGDRHARGGGGDDSLLKIPGGGGFSRAGEGGGCEGLGEFGGGAKYFFFGAEIPTEDFSEKGGWRIGDIQDQKHSRNILPALPSSVCLFCCCGIGRTRQRKCRNH